MQLSDVEVRLSHTCGKWCNKVKLQRFPVRTSGTVGHVEVKPCHSKTRVPLVVSINQSALTIGKVAAGPPLNWLLLQELVKLHKVA